MRVIQSIGFAFLLLASALPVRACYILFLSDGRETLVGNHEDWFAKDAAMRILPPSPGRYGSVIFTFMHEGWAQGGMNEHGLFFDAARTPAMTPKFESGTQPYPGYLWQAVLDKCKTVEEAIAFVRRYKIPELEEATFFFADASGDAAILGLKDGVLTVRRPDNGQLCQTNFNQWHPDLGEEPSCWRFERTRSMLGIPGAVSADRMRMLLEETHQDSLTVYSNIYDLRRRTVTTYFDRHFMKPITVSLPELFQVGACMVQLKDLEAGNDFSHCIQPFNYPVKGRVVDELTGQPVAFANIGVPMLETGTLSDLDGSFVLLLPPSLRDSAVFFAAPGYETAKYTRSSLPDRSGRNEIKLRPSGKMLDEVVVRSTHSVKRSRLGWMGGKDGILPLDTVQGGGAVAVLLEAPTVPVAVDKLQVRLMYNSKDTLVLRLRFYKYDSVRQLPGDEIFDKPIYLRETKRFGWLRFDLESHALTLKDKKFFVAFEWIDDRATRTQMVAGLREWERWKQDQFRAGNPAVELKGKKYVYHGNMMKWPGFSKLPPFTGLMIETGKQNKTRALRTFERKTSFGAWTEVEGTLNAVLTVAY